MALAYYGTFIHVLEQDEELDVAPRSWTAPTLPVNAQMTLEEMQSRDYITHLPQRLSTWVSDAVEIDSLSYVESFGLASLHQEELQLQDSLPQPSWLPGDGFGANLGYRSVGGMQGMMARAEMMAADQERMAQERVAQERMAQQIAEKQMMPQALDQQMLQEEVTKGSRGHPEFCSRPCVYASKGACLNGSNCTFCHLPHTSTPKLDKRQRCMLQQMSNAELLATLHAALKAKVKRAGKKGTDLPLQDIITLLEHGMLLEEDGDISKRDLQSLQGILSKMSVASMLGLANISRFRPDLRDAIQAALTELKAYGVQD
mmetsp:Transcript_39129/g.93512  ORF Transcript_39129/g.93512 Transcript_39129/m.93512 type:complete len:316 (+) Transcript_39129:67-1014(+)|eukprot:CAMPEP_0181447546 /NCGR_PEP_ID=MMETSP1110-20121109/26678_1 /TAXON_ID=174948 /ORGANISM="Symbiodinium sp., Strain CCMP421" /LENGTH=315 /DNA_ID=CAMNT_0023571663 /DNA_START=67 /DNA_END=1014 /DNA_ORIENTATION=-